MNHTAYSFCPSIIYLLTCQKYIRRSLLFAVFLYTVVRRYSVDDFYSYTGHINILSVKQSSIIWIHPRTTKLHQLCRKLSILLVEELTSSSFTIPLGLVARQNALHIVHIIIVPTSLFLTLRRDSNGGHLRGHKVFAAIHCGHMKKAMAIKVHYPWLHHLLVRGC